MFSNPFRIVLVALALLGAGLALYGLWLEPSSLRLGRHDVPVPSPLKGLKIAVIADLHGGSPFIDGAKIAEVVALTNAAHPDLTLLTGDYVISGVVGGQHMKVEAMLVQLRQLRARLGVYAVIGNHDRWEDEYRIAAAFRAAGIPVLENRHIAIARPQGPPLYLAGIGDYHTDHSDPAQALIDVPRDTAGICFTHSPDILPALPATCALTLAGHTHGGQVRLPFLGRPVVPSRHGQRYAAGLVRERNKTLFVSTGIGTSIFPVRLGVPPEVSLLSLE